MEQFVSIYYRSNNSKVFFDLFNAKITVNIEHCVFLNIFIGLVTLNEMIMVMVMTIAMIMLDFS